MDFMLALTMDVLRVMLAANIPVKLESLPGAGKTSLLNNLVEASNGYMHTMVAVNHDPTDFGGIPKPGTDYYDLLPGRWAADLAAAVSTHDLVVLFLDEVNTAGRAVMAALLKTVDERMVGGFRLPPEVRMVLAMNPAHANGGVELPSAMANRVGHVPFLYPLDKWAASMRAGGVFEPQAAVQLIPMDELVVATVPWGTAIAEYAITNVGQFEQYPTDAAEQSKAWGSRRTWTLGARAMGASDLLGHSSNVRFAVLESLVGKKGADGLQDFVESRLLVDPVTVLGDPTGYVLPTKDDELFMVIDRVTAKALDYGTQSALDAVCTVLLRVGDEGGRPGVAATGMRNVALFLQEHRNLIGAKQQETIRFFKPVVEAVGAMLMDTDGENSGG